MLKGVLSGDNGEMLLLGLSRENVGRLTQGKPIIITADELGELGLVAHIPIIIHFGETEEDILDEIRRHDVPVSPIQKEG